MVDIYTADFESSNSNQNITDKKTNVWLWDICKIDTLEHTFGANIASFFDTIRNLGSCKIYFHNLKFDGGFILDYLLKNGYTHTEGVLKKKTFSTLITDLGVYYQIKIKYRDNIIEIRDSSKKISGSVDSIAKAFKLPIKKGSIDYNKHRPDGYIADKNEIEYIFNDTEIMARALAFFYSKGMDKMTCASDSFTVYKGITKKYFKYLFPIQDYDRDCYFRDSYRGGVSQIGDNMQGKILQSVYVYDINSLYPSIMRYSQLPFGEPVYFEGEYIDDIKFPLYIQRVSICCRVKKGYQPTILLPQTMYNSGKYLETTDGILIDMTFTSVDLDLIKKHYDIFEIIYHNGYKFRSSASMFKKFVDDLYQLKCTTDGALKQMYKILLNSLYGKFAMNPKKRKKIPYLNEHGEIKFSVTQVEITDSVYTPLSSFITSYARQILFEAIQKNHDNFVYCDTDSIHLTKPIKGYTIDPIKLGAFKREHLYHKAIYLAQKTYIGEYKAKKCGDIVNIIEKKICGCPQNVKDKITFDNFAFGNEFFGKLLPKRVNGGILLVPTSFTIKQR